MVYTAHTAYWLYAVQNFRFVNMFRSTADAGQLAATSAGADVNQRARIAAVAAARYRPARTRSTVDRAPRRFGSDPGRQPRRSPPAAVVPRRPRSRRPAAAPRSRAGLERQRETDVRQVRVT